ncbi:MAG TPA: hypothetical protein VMT61_06475 [Candidatus Binataceae bacterium]|nr:hypothetical protein [Candidatus Binataceae bacterium]
MGAQLMKRGIIGITTLLLIAAGLLLPAHARAQQATDITGKWVGTSKVRCGGRMNRLGRCNAVQNISFDFKQDGAKYNGDYTCAHGTQDCLGLHEKGKIVGGAFDGSVLTFRVDFGTGSTCTFKGGFTAAQGQGSYKCEGSGGPEHGTWRVARPDSKPVPGTQKNEPVLRKYLP